MKKLFLLGYLLVSSSLTLVSASDKYCTGANATKKTRAEARVAIDLPRFRSIGPPQKGNFPTDHPLHSFNIIIENISNHDLDFFVAGNSWGDTALNFEMQGPDGKITPLTLGMRDYAKNIPTTVHLHPGQVYIREVSLTDGSYNGLSQFIATNPGHKVEFKVRACLTQATYKDATNKSMWVGTVNSTWYPVSFQRQ